MSGVSSDKRALLIRQTDLQLMFQGQLILRMRIHIRASTVESAHFEHVQVTWGDDRQKVELTGSANRDTCCNLILRHTSAQLSHSLCLNYVAHACDSAAVHVAAVQSEAPTTLHFTFMDASDTRR